ncbi:MAG: TIGR03087 family PEP-CTERM/XrtA system glycosyltransferase [Planctomycetaceae bacterium]
MKPRILYITHRVPWPPDRGDRIRTWNILNFLAERADVDLICLADEPVSRETRLALEAVTHRLAIVPHTGGRRYLRGHSLASGHTVTEGLFESRVLKCVVREWNRTAQYTSALASSSGIARYIQKPLLNRVGQVWIDLIDVDSQKWLDYAASASFPMSLVYRLEGRRLRKLECELAASTDRMLVVSEAERSLFRAFCPKAPIQAIGNGVDIQYFTPTKSRTTPHSCVFVGVLNYLPNSDAVKWFAGSVWPRVRQQYPDAVFRIVGRNPPAEIQALKSVPGIDVVGSVPDVRPWLHQSSCVVVPLRIARGVQNKVLEAMACGRPIVSSTAPLKGLDVEPGLQLLQADSVDEWVAAISSIFADRCRAEDLGIAASAWVQLNHRWDACLEPLVELLETRSSSPEQEIEVNG